MEANIKIEGITKNYQKKGIAIPVLKGVSMDINTGDFIALLGKSGSGKSSLLNIIGLLDNFDNGKYYIGDEHVTTKDEATLSKLRNQYFGYVFQAYNLLPSKTAAENVALPLYYRGVKFKDRMDKAKEYLEFVGMKHRMQHYPSEMSGGECQRIAIARAMVTQPAIILADEPTGALDSITGNEIMGLLKELNSKGTSIIMVTHEPTVAGYAQSVFSMKDGMLIS